MTDEGNSLTKYTAEATNKGNARPSSAPVCALGHLPPGEGFGAINPNLALFLYLDIEYRKKSENIKKVVDLLALFGYNTVE